MAGGFARCTPRQSLGICLKVARYATPDCLRDEQRTVGEFKARRIAYVFVVVGRSDNTEAILRRGEAAPVSRRSTGKTDARHKTFHGGTLLLFSNVECVRATMHLNEAALRRNGRLINPAP